MSDLDYRSEYLVRIFEKYIDKDSTILEIGRGDGRNIDFLKLAGYKNVEGIDKKDGTAIEDINPKQYDTVFSMSTLFLIPSENDWVFEKIANMTKKYIITIEGETSSGGVTGRNYEDIFTPFGFEQLEHNTHVFNEYGVSRVFKRI